ncbi:MAG: VOC family protein [Bacillota bacterium]|nr:VOC family protein [Bacillota bacterium]
MELNFTLNSLYICVKNMDRAIDFYQRLLDIDAETKDQILSIFNISGFRFCLFNNGKVNEMKSWGNNCLPSFKVNDINKLLERLKELNSELVFPLTRINDNWVLEFEDSEGNHIEAYSKIV